MKNNATLLTSASGFISAIFISSFVGFGISFFLFLIFVSGILFLFRRFFVTDTDEKRKIFLMALFLFSFALGVLRYEIADANPLDANLENNIGNTVSVVGVITDEPEVKESGQILTVDLSLLASSSADVPVSGRALVSTGLYPAFAYGDKIEIYGTLKKPKNFSIASPNASSTDAEDLKEFDYISYLGKDNIAYEINFAGVSFISSGHGNPLAEFLFKIKNAFVGNIDRVIPAPESPLLSGILLGAKSSIDKDTSAIFRVAGLSHIVALSGYNITVVAEAIMATLSFLPKTIALSTGVFGIILFVIMSGSSATAVRAGIMSLIVIAAQLTRRNYQIGRALIFAALLMILINPKILVFDISFQLSFLATIAIIYVAPIVKTRLAFVTEKFGFRETIASTISAQILVLPLILYDMGLLSLVALPANILVLAFVPASMLFGFATGMLGFIWLPLSLPFAWISYLVLAYMIHVAGFLASLPFASVTITSFSVPLMIVCYILITLWIVWERKNQMIENQNEKS